MDPFELGMNSSNVQLSSSSWGGASRTAARRPHAKILPTHSIWISISNRQRWESFFNKVFFAFYRFTTRESNDLQIVEKLQKPKKKFDQTLNKMDLNIIQFWAKIKKSMAICTPLYSLDLPLFAILGNFCQFYVFFNCFLAILWLFLKYFSVIFKLFFRSFLFIWLYVFYLIGCFLFFLCLFYVIVCLCIDQ